MFNNSVSFTLSADGFLFFRRTERAKCCAGRRFIFLFFKFRKLRFLGVSGS